MSAASSAINLHDGDVVWMRQGRVRPDLHPGVILSIDEETVTLAFGTGSLLSGREPHVSVPRKSVAAKRMKLTKMTRFYACEAERRTRAAVVAAVLASNARGKPRGRCPGRLLNELRDNVRHCPKFAAAGVP